jgi:hypothetical protein
MWNADGVDEITNLEGLKGHIAHTMFHEHQ